MGHRWVIYLGKARGRQQLSFRSPDGCGRSAVNPVKGCEMEQITRGPRVLYVTPVLDRGQGTEPKRFLSSSLSFTG